jgi:MbtH protein
MREEEQNWTYKVLINDEGQYSLWPEFKEIPDGWRSVGVIGSKTECLAFIDSTWKDMRPLSLKKAMETDSRRHGRDSQ